MSGFLRGGLLRPNSIHTSANTKWYRAGGAPTPVAAYQPKGAASLAASYVNLVTPGTHDLTVGSAPTFDASTGWTFNGSQHLISDLVPANTQAWSMIVRFSSAAQTVYRCLAGCRNAGPSYVFELWSYNTDTSSVSYANGSNRNVTPGATGGVLCVAGNQGYRDGAADGATLATGSGTNVAMFVGGTNSNGSVAFRYSGKMQAIAIYNATLTAGQVVAVSAAMAAL